MNSKRRRILQIMPALVIPGSIFAELLNVTPRQTSGPFYPDQLPLDQDNDLIVVNDSLTPAIGQILNLHGYVTDVQGRAIKNAHIEIWQTDANGRYIHSRDFQEKVNDINFQGYGQFATDSSGGYRFRTIRPVAYGSGFGARTPHIHFAVSAGEFKPLITQMYFTDVDNSKDGLWSRLSAIEKQALTVQTNTVPDSPLNEQAAQFNIILG